MISVQELKQFDRDHKPSGFDEEMILSQHYYDDSARQATKSLLAKMGLGLRNLDHPIQIALLRRVIDRLATVYDRPATRWLIDKNRKRQPEDSKDHEAMSAVLARAMYDLVWRKTDRLRSLYRQEILRVSPCDEIGGVVVRLFPPHCVARKYSDFAADYIEADEAFGLQLESSNGKEKWELWNKIEIEGQPRWFVVFTEGDKHIEAGTPFPETDGLCPYKSTPVQVIYDDYPGGIAWLPPRESRVSWVEGFNIQSNDLLALTAHEAHTETVLSTPNQEDRPLRTGPGTWHIISPQASITKLSNQPKIDQCMDVLEDMIRLFTLSEDLPASEFDHSKTVLTGLAKKLECQPLIARREGQLLLARRDEVLLYRKLRDVHNLHTQRAAGRGLETKWDLPELSEAFDISVDFAPINIPVDASEFQEGIARSIALGTKSTVDAVQEESGMTREEAKNKLERVKQDDKDFPPRIADPSLERGTKMTTTNPDSVMTDGKNSVVAGIAANDTPFGEGQTSTPDQAVQVETKSVDTAPSIALNGAQVTSLLDIIEKVAMKRMPRSTGLELIVSAFAIDPHRADEILGEVGKSFFIVDDSVNKFNAPANDETQAPSISEDSADVDQESVA